MTASSRKTKWVHGRSAHRQRSHDEAHADASAAPVPAILAHALVPAGEPAIIASQAEFDSHIRALRASGRFAFDTEFIGEHSYHAKLCVIQTATAESVAIIDPLSADLNMQALWELLADESVQKIVHAGEQDLEPVLRHAGRPAANVLDTQVIAAFAGWGYPTGMSRMIRELLGADPGHGLTFSQWDRRPLSRVQTLYAANDVRYLLLLYETLANKAREIGNLDWALEECRSLCATERFVFDAESQRSRIRGVEALTPRELAILTELLAWREHAAQEEDAPPRALLRDGILMDMVRTPPHAVADLDRVSGLPRPVETRWGAQMIEAVARGLAAKVEPDSAFVPFDRWVHRDTIDELWERAAAACRTRQIDSGIATSKREIGQFVRGMQTGAARETAAGRLLRGWREQLFGEVFRAFTAG